MEELGIFLQSRQQDFRLDESMKKTASFPFHKVQVDFSQYRTVISRFIQSLP
jgi:hypothetical protein